MSEPLGKDCNKKPIYVGSRVIIVMTSPSNAEFIGKDCMILGMFDLEHVETDLSHPMYSKIVSIPEWLMVIDPEPGTIEETREVETV